MSSYNELDGYMQSDDFELGALRVSARETLISIGAWVHDLAEAWGEFRSPSDKSSLESKDPMGDK